MAKKTKKKMSKMDFIVKFTAILMVLLMIGSAILSLLPVFTRR